ncbi:uncharacterized protein At5g19025 [Dioscorea cayenensis subsp. rotundata]|uniref:Uncharacterized protein At5g19025 n=1 Tax=Dioscorea cayennensis subsp. rotundata TaxID=55577 RepID=A0AB40AYJ7_DIOCR|nr:uncharacterized protein At5g19025 [Dioscorea cayenensis subsp. rotundata]
MAPSPSASSSSLRPRRLSSSSSHPNPSSLTFSHTCKHSPSATLDLLILILVLFSCTFLIFSFLSYLFRSISFLLPSFSFSLALTAAIPILVLLLLALAVLLLALSLAATHARSRRRCANPHCKGLKKALEFDVQLQTEDAIRASPQDAAWRAIDALPWKGGQGGNNPDYERLRAELRRMAPPNGRAVLLFRLRCGCPVSKLEAWGPKRARRTRKGTAKLALEGVNR